MFNFIDNVALGGTTIVDKATEALWVFDGTLVDGMIKDWSPNENHLVPNQKPQFEHAQFGKVLLVTSGLQMTSRYTLNLDGDEPHCLEIYFKHPAEDPRCNEQPYASSNNHGYTNIPAASYICAVDVDGTDYYNGGLVIDKNGRLYVHTEYDNPAGSPVNLFYLIEKFWNSDCTKYHYNLNDNGEPYYQFLNHKAWIGLAINSDGNDFSYYVNGQAQEAYDASLFASRVHIVDPSNFTLFPYTDSNWTKNVAFIRLSNRERTTDEIHRMLRCYSASSGYFKHLKLWPTLLGDYEITKEQCDNAMTLDAPLLYSLPDCANFTRSGLATMTTEPVGHVYTVASGTERFDFNEYGDSYGLLLEDTKQNKQYYSVNPSTNLYSSYFSGNWSTNPGGSDQPAEYTFDPCIAAVYGERYGESNWASTHYWNMNVGTVGDYYGHQEHSFVNSGIYTFSTFVRNSANTTDSNFWFTASISSRVRTDPAYNTQDPDHPILMHSMRVVDACPEFLYSENSSVVMYFEFDGTELLDSWKRLWVTFQVYSECDSTLFSGLIGPWQLTYGNQAYASHTTTAAYDSWAMDCSQIEEGCLSSWMPHDLNPLGYRHQDYVKFNLTDYVIPAQGSIMLDYTTKITYSGTHGYAVIANIGDDIRILHSGMLLHATYADEWLTLDSPITGFTQARLAFTWDPDNCYFYRMDTEPDEIASGVSTSIAYPYLIPHSGSAYQEGTSFYLKNLKVFERALSLSELKLYD